MKPGFLTVEELAICEALGDVFNRFAALPDKHPSAAKEMATVIHAAQEKVMAQAARRAYPEVFN